MTRCAALALLLAAAAPAQAALETGAAFLSIDPSARSAALGGAYTAQAGMADAAFFNPAGLAAMAKDEFTAGHAQWLAQTSFDTLALGLPLGARTAAPSGLVSGPTSWALGLSAVRLSAGSIDARTADRSSAGSFQAQDAAYGVSLAHGFGGLAVGGTFKLLRSQIGQYSAQTEAVDFGVRKEVPGRPLSLGFAVANLGPGYKFIDQRDPLPLTVSVGAAYRLAGVLSLALDVRQEPYDKRTSVAFGTEYALFGALALRAGYGANGFQRTTGQGPFSGLGAGLGLRARSFGVDYSFTPFGELGDVQRISLGARW